MTLAGTPGGNRRMWPNKDQRFFDKCVTKGVAFGSFVQLSVGNLMGVMHSKDASKLLAVKAI